MSKRKIVILVSSLVNEGPVNVIYNTLVNLNYSLIDVTLLTLIAERKNSRLEDFEKLPINIVKINPLNDLNPLQLFNALNKAINALEPDFLHAHCPRSLFLMHFLSKRWLKGYTIHIYPGLQQKVLYGNLLGSIVIKLSKYFIKKLDVPVACADNVRDEFQLNDGISVKSVPNGSKDIFSKLNFTPDSVDKNRLRQELGLKLDKKYFLFIGRFSEEKNPLFLVEAMNRLNNPNIGLIMLGEGPLWEKCKEMINSDILLTGFIKDIYRYIFAADYYVSTSSTEGLANTLLETMSAGLPFLVSDIPPHMEVIRKTDECMGFSFKDLNPNSFEEKLNSLLNSNYIELSKSVRKCFLEHYTDVIMAKKYQDLYLSVENKTRI